MKTTIRKNITDLPYSLHDAVVTAVECEEDSVTLRFAEGFFEPSEGDCRRVEGFVVLEGVDYDFCNAYVLNSAKDEGSFRGHKMPLKDFAEKYFSKAGKTPHPSLEFAESKLADTFPSRGRLGFKYCLLKEKSDGYRFEIISETYGYNKSTFSGWLWEKSKPKECILELYHAGDMRYLVEG